MAHHKWFLTFELFEFGKILFVFQKEIGQQEAIPKVIQKILLVTNANKLAKNKEKTVIVKFSNFFANAKLYFSSMGKQGLVHDIRHFCTRFRIDGIKAMSRGLSGGKQVMKFANTSNRGRVCRVCLSSLFAVRTSTVAAASKRKKMILSTYNLLVLS